MIMHYIELALIFVLALVIYWELLELKGQEYGPVLTALRVLPVLFMPVLAMAYLGWYANSKTERKKFKMPINVGFFIVIAAYFLYYFY